MSTLRLALAQVNSAVGDLEGNAQTVLRLALAAQAAGADLVAFPEMVLTGYPIEDLALRGSFRRAVAAQERRLAAALVDEGAGDVHVVVGSLSEAADGRPTNTAAVLRDGRVVARYTKHHLPNYGVFDEYRIFASGSDPVVVDVAGHRVGLAICEDIWRDGGTVAQLASPGVDLLLVINGSPYERGKGYLRSRLAAERAAELSAPVAYVNLIGGQDDLVFDGGSFVLDVDGTVVARSPTFDEDLLLLDLPGAGDPPEQPGHVARVDDDTAQMYDAVVLGLRDYARKNGFTDVVLGISGGIDSALTATVACDAVGADHVLGVAMPSAYSSEHSLADARELAERTGLTYREQPIEPFVDAFQGELRLDGVPAENLQARVRGVVLMAISNAEGHLVIAPGNKSELAVGYSTIYDAGSIGGFAPLKDVLKTRVWELARYRNARARAAGETPPIPESSITKPPSAELRPGQKDSDSLPDYELLDDVLDAYVERALGRDELEASGFAPDVVDLVLRLVDRAEWKRRQYPLGPKVTSLAFGRDRRLPVTSRWREE
ncbi:NAD+ synthetase [Beutenbergia cavernae DSM 12333]|uniref:Glutamine-dependent NAD(+) synthetase n=1 Tax=Beutenbergia cavernae (strain ATCC BAA-8 / DSM 12333 / CCUG 43141 / JCM 11478 / NBRC 16432 / NCIMB 13614 / HKI 0122) TaxID=471853 RepID=C5C4X6_BEUC1|nr:NAD+ synthase [Beutenbergia cavernae]ACQ80104.1 NAD+ synthetase [Beutenbergia cavernae DSM 12333]